MAEWLRCNRGRKAVEVGQLGVMVRLMLRIVHGGYSATISGNQI